MNKGKIFTIGVVLLIGLLVSGIIIKYLNNNRNSNMENVDLSQNTNIQGEIYENSISDIYVVENTEGEYKGIETLINSMGEEGVKFYKSSKGSSNSSEEGMISKDDVVLIEINAQWDNRGGTNTDLVKSTIQAIINHPDGFEGEIIVADNGQAQYGPNGNGASMDWQNNNAKDRSQSIQKVVDEFAGDYKVSIYLWDSITENQVEEYSEGNYEDGFVLYPDKDEETDIIVSYAKFKTPYDTYVSFKEGIWDDTAKDYNKDKLKVINIPVLKHHSIYGATASVKNYMGTTSDKLTSHNAHNSIGNGGMGTQMVETSIPVLNIVDAIWINPIRGPRTPDSSAVQTNIIAASVDPIALDYWAVKNILIPKAEEIGSNNIRNMDPDSKSPGSFGYWLRLSMEELIKDGIETTMDINKINVKITKR